MKIQQLGDIVNVTELQELGAANSSLFREQLRAALPETLKAIDIDLSMTRFVDSCGLGALISLHKTATSRNGDVKVRLLNPTPPVQQIFELTRMHRLFEIVKTMPA